MKQPARRLADFGRDVHAHAASRSRSCQTGQRHRRRRRRRLRSAVGPGRRPGRHELPALHRTGDRGVQHGRVRTAGRRHVRQRAAQRSGTTPASSSGISRCSRTSAWAARAASSSARRCSTSSTTRTWGRSTPNSLQGQNYADPTNGNFGRITSKTRPARHPAERAVPVLSLRRRRAATAPQALSRDASRSSSLRGRADDSGSALSSDDGDIRVRVAGMFTARGGSWQPR